MAEAIAIEGKPYVIDPTAQQTVTTVDLFKALAPRLEGKYLITLYNSAGVLKIEEGKGQLPSGGVPTAFGAGKVQTPDRLTSLEEYVNDMSEAFTKSGVVKVVFDKLVPATPATPPAPPTGGIPTIALLLGGAAVLYFIFRKKD